MNLRTFLLRGLLAGLFAGLLTFAVAYVVGESSVDASIAIEESHAGAEPAEAHDHADEPGVAAHDHGDELVSRSLQSTAGLATATLVAGTTLGGLVGMLSALALGRFGAAGPRATTLLVAGLGFVALYVVPFAVYPPNPPAVGRGETIGLRTALYFTMIAVSLIGAGVAVAVARRLAPTWGAWYATLAVVAGYLGLVAVAKAILPTYNEVPDDFPAVLLYHFRTASFLTQLTLWTVLGVTLAELVQRAVRPAPKRVRDVVTV